MFIVSDKLIFLVTSVLTTVLRVLTSFVMMRLLIPEDYGLLGFVALAPGFLAPLGDCGIARALVQYRDLAEVVESAAMVVSLALGGIYAAVYMGSGLYLYFAGYHILQANQIHPILVQYDMRVIWVGIMGAVTVFLGTIYTFQMSCLNRDLRFRAESFQNLIFATAQAITGLSLALVAHRHRELGVFAVAAQPLVAQFISNIAIYHRHPFYWPRAFRVKMAQKMLNYGWKITLAQYMNSLPQSVVNTFAAVVGGPGGLGVFGRATQVSDMVGYNMMVPFDRLLHPLMRTIRDDEERLRGIFVRGCIGITLLSCFAWAWLSGTAPDLIRVMLGPQWSDVPLLLRIVCVNLLTIGLGTMAVIIFHALGKPLMWLRFATANVAVLLAATWIGFVFQRSLATVAIAFVIAQSGASLAMWIWVIRKLRVKSASLIGHVVRLTLVAVAAHGSILLSVHWMTYSPLVRLIVGSGTGGLVFLGLVFLIDRQAIIGFRSLLPRRVSAEAPAPLTQPPTVWQSVTEISNNESRD